MACPFPALPFKKSALNSYVHQHSTSTKAWRIFFFWGGEDTSSTTSIFSTLEYFPGDLTYKLLCSRKSISLKQNYSAQRSSSWCLLYLKSSHSVAFSARVVALLEEESAVARTAYQDAWLRSRQGFRSLIVGDLVRPCL